MNSKLNPCLWFSHQAEEAANFYAGIFPHSKIHQVSRYPAGTPGPEGSVMTVDFELDGQRITALNGGPQFPFTPAVSLVVNCDTQAELDHYWDRLGAGGAVQQCGWLSDRYGLCWQIVPSVLPRLLKTPQTTAAVMQALMQMIKLDIATLQAAHDRAGG